MSIDDALMFHIIEHAEGRKLMLLNEVPKRDALNAGNYALISPLHWEIYAHDVTRIVLTHRAVVLDLQGYTRYRLGNNEVVNEGSAVLPIMESIPRHNDVLVKLSLEDLNNQTALLSLLLDIAASKSLPVIITMGSKGVLALNYDGSCIVVSPRLIASNSTGAGDILATLFLYALYLGNSWRSALLKAVAGTVCALVQLDKGNISRGVCANTLTKYGSLIAEKLHLCNKCCLSYLPVSFNWKRHSSFFLTYSKHR